MLGVALTAVRWMPGQRAPDHKSSEGASSDASGALASDSAPTVAAPPTGGALVRPKPTKAKPSDGAACAWLFDSTAMSVARARGEGRVVEHIVVQTPRPSADIVFEKDITASPTASDVTGTEESVTTEFDGECDDVSRTIIEPVCLPPRCAALSSSAAGAALLGSPGSSRSGFSNRGSSSSASAGEGDSSRRRLRKKPPTGLPPTSLVDGVSALPVPYQGSNSAVHMQSWCSAPVRTRLSSAGADSTTSSASFDMQRRADWVQDAGLSV